MPIFSYHLLDFNDNLDVLSVLGKCPNKILPWPLLLRSGVLEVVG